MYWTGQSGGEIFVTFPTTQMLGKAPEEEYVHLNALNDFRLHEQARLAVAAAEHLILSDVNIIANVLYILVLIAKPASRL